MALYTTAIQQLYIAYFSRPADAGGLEWWESVVAGAKGDTSMISAEFAKSSEYTQTFARMNTFEIVRTVYINLFGREPEKAGVDFWAASLDKGTMKIDAVVTEIAKGARDADLKAFNNKVIAATAFTAALDTYRERAAYGGPEAQRAAKAFIRTVTDDASLAQAIAPDKLAASVEAFVDASRQRIEFVLSSNADTGLAFTGGGGNDVFRATSATLGAGDAIDGKGGIDRLVLSDLDGKGLTALPAGFSTTSIESFTANSSAGIGTATSAFEVSGHPEMSTLSFIAKGAVNVKIDDTAEALVETTGGPVNVAGGQYIYVKGNTGAATLTGKFITEVVLESTHQDTIIDNPTPGHTLELTLDKVTGGATVRDAEATTVNLTATFSHRTSAPGNNAPPQPGVDVNLDFAKATALNITSYGPLTLGTTALAAADVLQSITLHGSGGDWAYDQSGQANAGLQADLSGIATLKRFDASASASKTSVKIAATAGLTVKGASWNDRVVITGQLAGDASVQLGEGSDTYEFVEAARVGAKVDAGGHHLFGGDTLVVNDGSLLNTEGQVYTNFEILQFSNGKGRYDLDKVGNLTRLVADKPLRDNVEFVNGGPESSISLTASEGNLDIGNIKFSLKDASGTRDTLGISLQAKDVIKNGKADGVVEVNSIEANGIERVYLSAYIDVAEFTAHTYHNAISSLYIDGTTTLAVNSGTFLSLNSIHSSTLTTIDASQAFGIFKFAGNVNPMNTAMTRLSYLGSNGKDLITAHHGGIVFQGNRGGDELVLHDGRGVADIIRFATVHNESSISLRTKGFDNMDTYYNFESGVDKIDLAGLKLAAGANREGIAGHQLSSLSWEALTQSIGTGSGYFREGAIQRSLAFASQGGNDGFVMVDVNGDGNFSADVDLVFSMQGNFGALKLTDFIWS